ncbi:hypothetical protein [Candidatus Scalindua japonica]|nr:hypothetical protein [Candidatus Scalindua japonica]
MTKSFWIGIIIIIIVSVMGVFYQKYLSIHHCAYDGSAVTAIYEVDIVLNDGSVKKFCSIYCATKWFKINIQVVDHVIVTDEIRGNKIDSYMAYFVESDLITNKTNNNRIHAFQQRQHAQTHAKKFNGSAIDDPFEIDE